MQPLQTLTARDNCPANRSLPIRQLTPTAISTKPEPTPRKVKHTTLSQISAAFMAQTLCQ